MAEREGISALDGFPETKKEAAERVARERLSKQEFELEMMSGLPPEFQPGGIYSLLSTLGQSFPDLQYHSFGQVPGRFREAFEELEDERKEMAKTPVGRRRIKATYPTIMNPDGGALLGSFVPDISDAKQRAKEVIADNFLQSARRGTTLVYGPPHSDIAMPSLIGKEFYESASPAKKFNVVDMKEGEVGPGFLTGPTSSSILLSRLPASLSGYDAGRQGGTLFHELFHAGSQHPRITDFIVSENYSKLDPDLQKGIAEMVVDNHKFLYPLDDYEQRYRDLTKKGEDGQSGIDTILNNIDAIRAKNQTGQGMNEEEVAKFEEMVSINERGGDPVDFLVKQQMDPEDVEKLDVVEKANAALRIFLNETSDIKTGETRGNLYYPPRAVPKPTKP